MEEEKNQEQLNEENLDSQEETIDRWTELMFGRRRPRVEAEVEEQPKGDLTNENE